MARTSSTDRARRLIALINRFDDANGARIPVSELAESLGVTPKQLERDIEILSMCATDPEDPSTCVPVIVEDGYVEVWGQIPALRRGVRLSPKEARALAAALQSAGFAADDPLVERVLAASAVDVDPVAIARALRSAASAHDVAVYETLANARETGEVVEIEHLRTGEPEPTCREIEPLRMIAERGVWYVVAWCRTADALRTFRLDRIRRARTTGDTFEPRADAEQVDRAFVAADLPFARLAFRNPADFAERDWPGATVAEGDSGARLLVDVPIADERWIARRVVARLGTVEALSPGSLRTAVRELASAELAAMGDA